MREGGEGVVENFVGRTGGVDAQEEASSGVVRDDGCGGFGVGGEAGLDGLESIVGRLLQRPAATIADPGMLGRAQRDVEDGVAMRADAAAGQALDERSEREFVTEDGVELEVFEREQGVERVSLGEGAWKTDEHEAACAAQAGAAIAQELEDDVVGDELAAVHAGESFGGGGAGMERTIAAGAEKFGGRERAGAEEVGEQSGLSVFSGAGRADEDEARGAFSGRGLQAVGRVAVKPGQAVSERGHGGMSAANGAEATWILAETAR